MPYKKSEKIGKWEKAIKALSKKKKKKSPAGVKTDVQKAPKYKGAPLPPKSGKKSKLKGKLGAGKVPESVKERMQAPARGKFAKGGPIKGTYAERVAKQKAHREEMKRITSERRAAKKAAKAEKKAAKKPVSVEKTKGGDYPAYKKESKKAESFRSKFAKSSKAGKKTFKWKGRSYTTEKAAPKKAAPKKAAKPDVRKIVKNLKETREKKPAGPSPTWGVGESKALGPVAPKKDKPIGQSYEREIGQSYERQEKQMGGMVDPATSPSIQPPGASYDEGGKVESNPYGWPTRDARSGLSKKK